MVHLVAVNQTIIAVETALVSWNAVGTVQWDSTISCE